MRRARGAVKRFSPLRISAWLPKCLSCTCSTYSRGGYPKRWVAREHFVLKDLPFYAAVRKEDARARKALLNEREERRQEGTLRKASSDKRSAPTPLVGAPARKKKKVPSKGKAIKLPTPPKEVVILAPTFVRGGIIIRELDLSVLPSISSGSGRFAGLNHSGPSLPAAGPSG